MTTATKQWKQLLVHWVPIWGGRRLRLRDLSRGRAVTIPFVTVAVRDQLTTKNAGRIVGAELDQSISEGYVYTDTRSTHTSYI